ncbi:MAG: hypothetical protein HQ523_14770 [Lentisphaerae bacterium]|nr:hypothetical protein [Lentisphaerota bacterium]
MASKTYDVALCRQLMAEISAAGREVPLRPTRYENGDRLELPLRGLWPDRSAMATFRIEKFIGGGFAGQVYRCVLEALESSAEGPIEGLEVGAIYGVKILIPPVPFAKRFRDRVYALAFQVPFSAQVIESACRAGVLWQKVIRRAAALEFGDEACVADVYAWFFDEGQQAFGEVREWVEGRMWRLEADTQLGKRRSWKTADPASCGSPEFIAKRQFMWRFVRLLHRMGAGELARQYEWGTLKSQPNLLKRSGHDDDPAAGLCAFDFRAGLALLPFLPMSPADIGLILRGLSRGVLVQFDRGDMECFRSFIAGHREHFAGMEGMLEALESSERDYRRSMPDISRQGLTLLTDGALRADVRAGLVTGYLRADLVDETYASRLSQGGSRFIGFYLLGAIPVVGRFLRCCIGNSDYRCHLKRFWSEPDYRRASWAAGLRYRLIGWLRCGRASSTRVRTLLIHPWLFWLQAFTLRLLPAGLHRIIAEPRTLWESLSASWGFMRSFFRDAAFRETWLGEQVAAGYKDGMLSEVERDRIMQHVKDPFIVKYLRSLGVHFATLPVTQVVSVIVATVVLVWRFRQGDTAGAAWLCFLGVLGFFQITPISPGSICRGVYVVALMIRERNYRDYLVAAPLSFVKYLGYLAFPFQMITTYPELARFMGSRWAMDAVRIVPVFGEHGALLEHAVFDLFFNVPRVIGGWFGRHARLALNLWMLAGVAIYDALTRHCNLDIKSTTNLLIAVVVLCILPRVLFYPVLKRR